MILDAAKGCAILLETVVSTTVPGAPVVQQDRLTIQAQPSCAYVDIGVPNGSTLTKQKMKIKLGDARRHKVTDERFETRGRDASGVGTIRVHLTDLVLGDTAHLDLWFAHSGPVDWAPSHAVWASIDGVDELTGLSKDKPKGGFTDSPTNIRLPNLGLRTWPGTSAHWTQPATPKVARTTLQRTQTRLHIPDGDPQIGLYPGGGSYQVVTEHLLVSPDPEQTVLAIPIPPSGSVQWTTRPTNAATEVRNDDTVWLTFDNPEGQVQLQVTTQSPDAPTYGHANVDAGDTVSVDKGQIVFEGDSWRLAAYDGRPILPNRSTLLLALDRRFRAACLPEPGLPMNLRGRPANKELAAELRPTVWSRLAKAAWPHDPIMPRTLRMARKTGMATPIEAALTLWVYAKQAGFDAKWALVGAKAAHSPDGAVHPMVVLNVDDEVLYIDPMCTGCAPFELPAEWSGMSVMGPGLKGNLPNQPVRTTIHLGETNEIVMEDASATLFRRWLGMSPASDREERIQTALGVETFTSTPLTDNGQPTALSFRGPLPEPFLQSMPWLTGFHLPAHEIVIIDAPHTSDQSAQGMCGASTFQRAGADQTVRIQLRSPSPSDLNCLHAMYWDTRAVADPGDDLPNVDEPLAAPDQPLE